MTWKALNQIRHKELMFSIINDIFDSSIKSKIWLKWWTLCLFVYGLDRFSVDLDFDVLKEWALDEIKKVVRPILQKYGEITDETKSKLILKYDAETIPLKLEFNTRIPKNDHHEVINFFGKAIVAMTKDCIMSNKLVALVQRKEERNKLAPRDLYDVRFFLKNHFPINDKLIKERSGKNTKNYFISLQEFIPKHFNQENILRGLGDLLTEKQKYFVKHKLIHEVLSQIEFFLWNTK